MKKGFTLIELLAVIVILAIIALIATPIVLNIIENSKQNADLRSAEMYLEAVELSIANSMLENNSIKTGTYNILENGNICLEDYVLENEKYVCKDKDGNDKNNELIVEVKGQTPQVGSKVAIEGAEVKKQLSTNPMDRTQLIINNKIIEKNEEGNVDFVFCTIQKQNSTQYTKGDKITCGTENFYLLSEEDDQIKMIAEKNINVTGEGEVKQMNNAGTVTFNCVNNQVIYYWKDDLGNYKENYKKDNFTLTGSFRYIYDENSNIYPYLNNYKNYLKKAIDLNITEIGIMSITQIVDFLELTSSSQTISGPQWLFSESSWLGSIYESGDMATSTRIFEYTGSYVIGGMNASPNSFTCSFKNGVRPLVTISTNYIN